MSTATLDPEAFRYISNLVATKSAIVLEPTKAYLVESRLTPVAKQHGYASLSDLVAALKTKPVNGLHHQVVEAMTTNETSFFRDQHPFDTLRTKILPELIQARAATKTLNIWCGAASTGQEPYTLAMVLREHFPALRDWNVRITATDLSSQVLAKAKQGLYNQIEINRGLPAALLVKYFQKRGLQWQISDELRRMVDFCELNLISTWPPLGVCDLVFLRNVLIYFSPETKREILGKIRRLLAKDGYLFLGGAETTMNLDDHYQRIQFEKTVCYQAGR
ncbi:MAG TPA: protein-glutamate O-methyltransferase CheR [Pirellulales bacterium]|nr:protein-glutamate O-methyltransferase CheR [Pirellulales bacterium]